MASTDNRAALNRHYAPEDLVERISEALRQAGKDAQALSHEDLAPLDQFHSRGKLATVEQARLAGLRPGMHVLDIGGGLGGPARTLAAEFGCRVTVLDITAAYCRAGEMLTARTGQQARVTFHCASALDMPFEPESFDVVWTQHCSMNIEDKERLYREAHRVLRAGGRLATYEIVAGPIQPIHFPVPWASDPALSFLRPAAAMRLLIKDAGFEELVFDDKSDIARRWFRERRGGAPGAPSPLGLQLLLGETFRAAFQNQIRNLEEQRVAVIAALYRKSAG